ncbi:MAG TPA: MGMT family protein [Candidatus Cloacimonadota bacterium]|nr:MGMT family protein [Candidatus Cloacimonadota bacterium]
MLQSTELILQIIRSIPKGKVTSYSRIGSLAGYPNGGRLVSRLLSSCSRKYSLPWHRVVSASGKISLPPETGGELQAELLRKEGVVVQNYKVDLRIYGWEPDSN